MTLEEFRQHAEQDRVNWLKVIDCTCEANMATAHARIVPGRKYTKVDLGGDGIGRDGKPWAIWSRCYMIDNETGDIFGIKGYGKIHKGHKYGNLNGTVIMYHSRRPPAERLSP